MTKLEELTELLVNEINTFEKGVDRLEKINNKLHFTKISIDIKEFKSLLNSHQKQMKTTIDSQESIYYRYEKLMKIARFYHNWQVIVSVIILILYFSSLIYLYSVK